MESNATPAITDARGTHSYADLDHAADRVAAGLLGGADDLSEARIAFRIPASFEYAVAQHAIWRAGGIAVPLGTSHPQAELDYVIQDAGVSVVIGGTDVLSALEATPVALPRIEPARRAMILYTSGTTGRPKGVVSTHANVAAQIAALHTAWEWRAADRILLVLPLHHVHGIINVLGCALAAGAHCEMHDRFDAEATWERLASGDLTLFMAVPTIYHKLIAAWERAPAPVQRQRAAGASSLRLMVSGSAALPVGILERWREITGHTLLERYGMTEIGMALANPLHGERRAGTVGRPLPGVELRLDDSGELLVRGPSVFLEYWQRPEETAASFREGWFETGDVAVIEDGYYRILGRKSTDIIKTGGYKVSALEIEEELRAHPAISECAVVAVADAEWGERICAAIELREGCTLELGELQDWAKSRLAPYKLPRALVATHALPRNAMGKVTKSAVRELFP